MHKNASDVTSPKPRRWLKPQRLWLLSIFAIHPIIHLTLPMLDLIGHALMLGAAYMGVRK